MVNSLPLINSSTKICSSSLKAFCKAGCKSSALFTLLIPILLPPLLGFTKKGSVSCCNISFAAMLSFLNKCSDFATWMPANAATATVYLLLKVSADVAASHDV